MFIIQKYTKVRLEGPMLIIFVLEIYMLYIFDSNEHLQHESNLKKT